MGIVDEFAKHGAKQNNSQWSVCAWTEGRKELVVSARVKYTKFNKETSELEVHDSFARPDWVSNGVGEMRKALSEARASKTRRLLVVCTGEKGSMTHHADLGKVGYVKDITGNDFVLAFRAKRERVRQQRLSFRNTVVSTKFPHMHLQNSFSAAHI